MTDTENIAARLETLETRIAYQDQAIEDLSKTITDQWKLIETLNRQLARLGDRVTEAEISAGAPNVPEPPPPHY